jgi:hypothetical protein
VVEVAARVKTWEGTAMQRNAFGNSTDMKHMTRIRKLKH